MGVRGRLADIGLVDIVQIFLAEKKTVAVHLTSEMGFGHVYLKDGKLVHAVYRDLTGREAFDRLLEWEDGEFEIENDAEPPEVTIGETPGAEAKETEAMKETLADGAATFGDDSMGLIKQLLELGILERVS